MSSNHWALSCMKISFLPSTNEIFTSSHKDQNGIMKNVIEIISRHVTIEGSDGVECATNSSKEKEKRMNAVSPGISLKKTQEIWWTGKLREGSELMRTTYSWSEKKHFLRRKNSMRHKGGNLAAKVWTKQCYASWQRTLATTEKCIFTLSS